MRIGWAVLLVGCAQGPTVPVGFFAPDGRCLYRGGAEPDLPGSCVLNDGAVALDAEPWMVASASDLEIELDGPAQLIEPMALRCCGAGGCATSTAACAWDQVPRASFRWRASAVGEVEILARRSGNVVFEEVATIDRAADYAVELYEWNFFVAERAEPTHLEVSAYSIEVRTVGTLGGFIRDDRSPHHLKVLDPEVAAFCYVLLPAWFLSRIDEQATALSLCGRSAGATSLVLEKAGQVRSLPIKFVGAQER